MLLLLQEHLLCRLRSALNRRDPLTGDIPAQGSLLARDILVDQSLALSLPSTRSGLMQVFVGEQLRVFSSLAQDARLNNTT